MSVKFTERKIGDVVIVDVEGRVMLGEGSAGLRDQVRALAERGETKVILNLKETIYFDSCGIGELVSGFARISNARGNLKLLAINQRITETLRLIKLYTIFEVFDDEAEAIDSFRSTTSVGRPPA